jgi:hypothetical protein
MSQQVKKRKVDDRVAVTVLLDPESPSLVVNAVRLEGVRKDRVERSARMAAALLGLDMYGVEVWGERESRWWNLDPYGLRR